MKTIKITKENVEEIIAKSLENRMSESEMKALSEWRKEKAENENYYNDMVSLNALYKIGDAHRINVDAAWKKVASKINVKDKKTDKRVRQIFPWSYIGFAASIILLLTFVYLIRTDDSSSSIITSDFSLNHRLVDGSEILLNARSSLTKLKDKTREYNFAGSAKFEIIHDEKNPFVLHLDKVVVKDLGTTFELIAIPGADTIFVSVSEGLVQFYTIEDSGITLEEGEEGMYVKSSHRFYKRAIDQKNAYLTKDFQEAAFSEVIDYLAYSFRKNITIENNDIINCSINVDFSKAPYSLVKEIIEETLNISITENDQSIILSGEGCH